MYVYIYIYVYMYVHVYMHVCMCVYIYIYMYIHMYNYMSKPWVALLGRLIDSGRFVEWRGGMPVSMGSCP